jgi:hypothetical protein
MKTINLTLASVALLTAGALHAATPIMEVNFNDANGDASLANYGSAAGTGSFVGVTPPSYSGTYAPVNAGGYSGSFTGVADSYANFGSISSMNGLSSFTITGWVNPASTQTNTNARLLVYKGNLTQSSGIDLFISGAGSASQNLALGVDGTLSYAGANLPVLASNSWTFFAVSYDGTKTSNNLIFYVGDANNAVSSYTTTLNAGAVGVVAGQQLTIGGCEVNSTPSTPSSTTRNYAGLLDDISVYGSASDATGVLTEMEINAIRLTNDAPNIPEAGSTSLLVGLLAVGSVIMMRARRRR